MKASKAAAELIQRATSSRDCRGGELVWRTPIFCSREAVTLRLFTILLLKHVHISISRSMIFLGNVQQVNMDELRPHNGPVVGGGVAVITLDNVLHRKRPQGIN
jgi:hypothetical protein